MTLIALKNISSKLRKGTIFEEGNRVRAKLLIHLKAAALFTETVLPAPPTPQPVASAPPEPTAEPAPKPVRRSTRVGAHAFTRTDG